MPVISIICGAMLVVVGVVGYIYSTTDGKTSYTALIPAAFGFVIMDCGILSKIKDDWRKHLMHVAVVVALIGFVLTAGRILMKISTLEFTPAVISQISMALICLAFVIFGIKSFAAARRGM